MKKPGPTGSTGTAKHAGSKTKHAAAKPAKHASSSSPAGITLGGVRTAPAKTKAAAAKHHPAAKTLSGPVTGTVVVTTAKARTTKPKVKQWSPGSLVACCSAEALAASLRLAGGACGDADTLGLYFGITPDPDAGTSILDALQAAVAHGLAGAIPGFQPVTGWGDQTTTLVAGVDLPEPHAVLITPDAWWSWGEPWPESAFSRARITDMWEVTWHSG